LRVLIIGDSSAAGVGVETQDQALAGQLAQALSVDHRVTWRLEARTGVTSAKCLKRLRQTEPETFDVAVIALGVNDATRLLPTRAWVRTGQEIRAHLRRAFDVRHIYVTSLPPLGEFPLLPQPLARVLGQHADRMAYAQQEAVAQEDQTDLVTFDLPLEPDLMAKDGFHPGPEVYRLWAQEVARRIRRDLPD
jgi:lysophospholipase L1-like esterase